jgi:GcrA cell cycle regulator
MVWSDDEVVMMRELWLQGESASQIAKKLRPGKTRNAVLGKIHRLGLTTAGRGPAAVPSARAPLAPGRPGPPPKPRRTIALATKPVALPGKSQCKWPIGDPAKAGFYFCPDTSVLWADGSPCPYCEKHRKIAYQPPAKNSTASDMTRALRRYI